MIKTLYIAFFALFTVAIFNGNNALAQDTTHYPIGQIAVVEGTAFTTTGENRKPANPEDPVFLGTIIKTGANAKVMILFIDDTQIALGENAELVIDEYIFDPYDAEENIAEFEVMQGAFHWVSGMISKRERPQVKIRTPGGSIGIRGTEFWAGDIEDGYGVFVVHGLIAFEGTWGAVEIPINSGSFVKPEEQDFKPDENYWSSERRKEASGRTSFKLVDLHSRLQRLHTENEKKRHDWRGRMFPHKPNPYMKLQRGDGSDEFYTDEFEEIFDYNKPDQ